MLTVLTSDGKRWEYDGTAKDLMNETGWFHVSISGVEVDWVISAAHVVGFLEED